MLIDLHVHTHLSADSNASPVEYLEANARAGRPLGAICFTEHRLHRIDAETERTYGRLSERFGTAILMGVEADTDLGHLLLFGITPRLERSFDLSARMLSGARLIEAIYAEGGIAIPAHPFRDSGFGPRLEELKEKLGPALIAIEVLNGQNSAAQNSLASAAASRCNLAAVAGSDAHFTSPKWFLTCATEFDSPVSTVTQLCAELRDGRVRPRLLTSGVR